MPEVSILNITRFHRRGFVFASLLLAGFPSSGCLAQTAEKPPKVLFVCQAGTAKSAIAREIFKRRAKELDIAVDVSSRGIEIADHVSPQLKENLRADGLDTNAEPAMQLAAADWAAADILITFNPLPTSVEHKDVRDWTDIPSVNDNYANARMMMDKRIDALLTEVGNRNRR